MVEFLCGAHKLSSPQQHTNDLHVILWHFCACLYFKGCGFAGVRLHIFVPMVAVDDYCIFVYTLIDIYIYIYSINNMSSLFAFAKFNSLR